MAQLYTVVIVVNICAKNNYVTKPSEIFFSNGWPQVQDALGGIETAVFGVSDADGRILNKSDDFDDKATLPIGVDAHRRSIVSDSCTYDRDRILRVRSTVKVPSFCGRFPSGLATGYTGGQPEDGFKVHS